MGPDQTVANAKRAMAARDFAAALTALDTIDLTTAEPLAAVRILVHKARCAAALGRPAENKAHHRAAFTRLAAEGLLDAAILTPDNARLALSLAVGSFDAAGAKKYLRMAFGDMPAIKAPFKVSPLVDVRSWCRANAVPVVTLDEARDMAVDDGRGIGEAVAYRCEKTWHATIANAEIVAGWDFVVAPTGEVLDGANYSPVDKSYPFMPHAYCESAPAVAHPWPDAVTRIDADALFLSTPERHHFGHWVSEFLPRLRAWDRNERPRRKLAISAALPRKHRDLLARFGVTGDDLIECDVGRRYGFRSLRLVRTGRAEAPNPQDVRFISAALGPGAGPSGRHILFLERDAGTRRPANVDEVQSLFAEFGVMTTNLARLSLTEQIDLLKDTRAVIGAHGTDLFCLYMLRPGAAVIELHWDAREARVFGPACAILGIDHRLVISPKAEERGGATYKKDGDIVVDCAKLRERLAALA